ncbi:MAG: shikimate kinase [Sporomusaceae bacterium]|jgi:shikimate kinase|nr:shikimate kinase [Sporomusaceae bacterium]
MKNIVLIGFMGTGKTSVGRLLAARLNRQFVDIDKKIEIENKMSVSEIFELHGEHHFRQLESEVIKKVARQTNVVIATGGGAVLRRENRLSLRKNGLIVSLSADLDTIAERTAPSLNRPLLEVGDKKKAIASLLAKRASLYEQADYLIDTSGYSPQYVTEKIIVFLREGGYLRGRSFS